MAKKPKPNPPYLNIFFVILIISFSVLGLHQIFLVERSSRPETVQNTVKKLPKEIAKKYKESTTSATFRIPILMYHYIENVKDPKDTIRISLNILPQVLEAQIKTLKDDGYVFLTAADLANIIDGKINTPQKPILLTFDDGYTDFYTDAFPILKKYQAKATAYIVPGFINHPNYMYLNQLQEINNSGLVEFGAHTMHHIYLKGQLAKIAEYEIVQSKIDLEKKLSINVVSFAYPYGAFDQQSIDIVKKGGFKTAVSTIPGIEASDKNRFYIFRIRPGLREGITLLEFLKQKTFHAFY